MKKSVNHLVLISLLAIIHQISFAQQRINGNGNVIKQERKVENFNKVFIEEGIDLFLEQGNSVKLVLEADENLHDIIASDVNEGVLRIYPKKNIGYAKRKDVYLTITKINYLNAKEGADVKSLSHLKQDNIEIRCNEGSDLNIALDANKLICKLNEGSDAEIEGEIKELTLTADEGSDVNAELKSETIDCQINEGSDLVLRGSTTNLKIFADEGSDIEAFGMPAKNCVINISEGSDANLNVTTSLTVRAKSNSDVIYRGSPAKKDIHASESCSIISR